MNNPDVPDLDGFRVHMIHELIKARRQRQNWLFLMNGFAYDDINNRYIPDQVNDVPDGMNEHDDVPDDTDAVPDEQVQDVPDDPLKGVSVIVKKGITSVFKNGHRIARQRHHNGIHPDVIFHVDDGSISVEFVISPDDPDDEPDDQNSPNSISQKGSGYKAGKTAENQKISHIKQNKDGTRTRACVSNPVPDPDDPDDPEPTPTPPAPAPVKPPIPRRRMLMQRAQPSEAARATRAAIRTSDNTGNQKYLERRGKPPLFHFDGFLVTRDEIGLLRAAKALENQSHNE